MILTNGCSFTEGHDLHDQSLCWPNVLGNLLDKPVKNLALGGASNERIFRTTQEFLIDNDPELTVIGWTQFDRNELSHHAGFYVRCHGSVCLPECEKNYNDLEVLHQNWLMYNHNRWINYRNWIYKVLFLQKYFSQLGKKYLFFTAFGNNYLKDFLEESDAALDLADQSYQWRDRNRYKPERSIHKEYQELVERVKQIDLNNWVHPLSSMGNFLESQGFGVDHTGHYLEDGHQQWVKEIFNKVRQL